MYRAAGDKSNAPDLGDDPLTPELAAELGNDERGEQHEGRESNGEGELQGATGGGEDDNRLTDQMNNLELREQVWYMI